MLTEREIIDFAQQFDPQPYHLDRAAGDASIFGGLCASGWQVASMATRLVGDALLADGHPFVDITAVSNMRWKRPTFVDESIAANVTIVEQQSGSVVPGCNTAKLDVAVVNSTGDVVAEMQCSVAMDAGADSQGGAA